MTNFAKLISSSGKLLGQSKATGNLSRSISIRVIMKKYPKTAFIDKLHRGAVWTCIAVTLGGTALLGYRFYRYFSVVKPEKEALELRVLEVREINIF